jgi:ferredoxin
MESSRPASPEHLGAAQVALDAEDLRQICLRLGADDAGFVEASRPALGAERQHVEEALPGARTLISFVVRMNRTPVQSPARSVANLEFHHAGDAANDVARAIVAELERRGARALNPSMGFPMEMDRFPGRVWLVSHKLVAVQAGLGHMGIHRNVIHPRFGNFVLLGTVLTDAEVTAYGRPLPANPCLECKLCVAACPVGAIGADGTFNFSSCYTHNYREFMGGFSDWAEQLAGSGDAREFRRRVPPPETVSLWQSLSFGANYKAAYCMAVCPAGDEVSGPWRADRARHLRTVVRPLQEKEEPVYVLEGSDAEEHVRKRFPSKRVRRVANSLRPRSIEGFLGGLPLLFQRGQAKGLEATYHLTFTGDEAVEATVRVREGAVEVARGHHGAPDARLSADSRAWLAFLAGDRGLLGAVLLGKVRYRGPLRLLRAFRRCFPA